MIIFIKKRISIKLRNKHTKFMINSITTSTKTWEDKISQNNHFFKQFISTYKKKVEVNNNIQIPKYFQENTILSPEKKTSVFNSCSKRLLFIKLTKETTKI